MGLAWQKVKEMPAALWGAPNAGAGRGSRPGLPAGSLGAPGAMQGL